MDLISLSQQYIMEKYHISSFSAIISVGDLCNKGPQSKQVIQHFRSNPKSLFAVRGNHDDAALHAALGDKKRRNKKKYEWIFGDDGLSDDDVEFLSSLPYSITISSDTENFTVVHAGLVPGVALEEQEVESLLTVREVAQKWPTRIGSVSTKESWVNINKKGKQNINKETIAPWASVWKVNNDARKTTIVFGHDAKRGIQKCEFAIGLDSGCCYGRELTGLILPERKLICVKAKQAYFSDFKAT